MIDVIFLDILRWMLLELGECFFRILWDFWFLMGFRGNLFLKYVIE